jgi:hypothetical protein
VDLRGAWFGGCAVVCAEGRLGFSLGGGCCCGEVGAEEGVGGEGGVDGAGEGEGWWDGGGLGGLRGRGALCWCGGRHCGLLCRGGVRGAWMIEDGDFWC